MKTINLLAEYQPRIEYFFTRYTQNHPCLAPTLQKAITYTMLNGGKRIRPLLVYTTGHIFGADNENLDIAACAIELIHTYSLVHDDLPAMDNADLRRGKPSCHKAFDEATAILVGDALQTLAFEIIASHPSSLKAEQRIEIIKVLSHASGLQGMVTGQALDLAGSDSLIGLIQMYQLKTSALLNASVKIGAIVAGITDIHILNALESYAHNIGLAFQIQDDLLDIEDSNITGKTQGLDAANQKVTYLQFMDLEHTRKTIESLYNEALNDIAPLGEKATALCEMANFLLQRKK